MADTFGLGLNGGFQHIGVNAFGKYHTLRVAAGGVVELAGELAFIAHQLAQLQAVGIPVCNVLAGHTAVHSGFCHGAGHFGDEARVYRFRNEVFRTEGEVVHMVGFVHHVGYGLFGKIGDGVYGSNLHLFVDGLCLCIECAAEDIGEADNVVNLVRIVGTAGRHQYVRTRCHSVFVGYFRSRVGKGEYNGVVGHAAYHILRQYIAFGKAEEYVGAFDGFGKGMHVAAVGCKVTLLFGQVLAVAGDDAFAVQHQDVLAACAERLVQFGA